MLEVIERILGALMPLMVAVTTAYGAVLVAKVNKIKKEATETNAKVAQVQSDIITNHGSKNLGDAIDRLTSKVGVISDNQDDLIATVKGMQARDTALETRMSALEQRRVPHGSHTPTGPIPLRFKRKKK
ncbi:membrane protein [Microbacterium phage Kauala]|nr:membrane protein [Microbacterium phage Kauala]